MTATRQRSVHTRRILLLTVALGIAVGATGATGATATPRLSPLAVFAGNPFAGSGSDRPWSVAVNNAGDTIVGFTRGLGGSAFEPFIHERVGGARGAWRTPRPLAIANFTEAPIATAVNAQGDGLAVYQTLNGTLTAVRRSGGVWGLPVPVATGTSTARSLGVALSDDGRAAAMLVTPSDALPPPAEKAWTITVVEQTSPAGSWASTATLTTPPITEDNLAAALSRSGDVAVAWATSGAAGLVSASRRLAGAAAFDSPQTVSAPGATRPGVAIADNGEAAVTWIATTAGGGGVGKFADRAKDAGAWTPGPDVASSPGLMFLTPARDVLGNTLVAVDDGPAPVQDVSLPRSASAAYLPAGAGEWQHSRVLVTEGLGRLDLVAPILEQGRARVIVDDDLGPGANAFDLFFRNAATGGWSVPLHVSPDGYGMGFGSAPDGDVVFYRDGIVRNFDSVATPAAPVARNVRVRVSGRRATLRISMNTHALLWIRLRRLSPPTASNRLIKRTVAVGDQSVGLGRFAPGRYAIQIVPCSSRAGCSFDGFNRPTAFRIR